MKIKMNFKYAMMACTALAMGFASCSDDVTPEQEIPEEGGPTLVKISVVDSSDKGATTRAYGDFNATNEEKAVYRAKVYMFSATKALQKIVDLDYNATTSKWESIFEATAGLHYFIATANAPAVDVPIGTGLDALAMLIEGMYKDEFEAYLDPGAFDGNLENTDKRGFFMTTPVFTDTEGVRNPYQRMSYKAETLVSATKEELKDARVPEKNVVSIPVGRAMAKTNLTFAPDENNQNQKTVTHAILGDIGFIDFTGANAPIYRAANNPYKMYHFPYFGTVQLFQTPMYRQYPVGTVAKFWPELHDQNFFADNAGDYYNYKTPTKKRPTLEPEYPQTPSAFYLVENANEEPTWSNTTILQVKAKFVPNKLSSIGDEKLIVSEVTGAWVDYIDADNKGYFNLGTEVSADVADLENDGDFYRVWNPYSNTFEQYFFTTLEKAQEYAGKLKDPNGEEDKTVEVIPYIGGICYYMIPIRDASRGIPECHDVVRNHFYDIAINAITDCGYSEPGGGPGPGKETEPEDPLYPDPYFVKVAIQVLDWTHVMGEESPGIGYQPK